MDLKNILKTLKLQENNISMVLGVAVLIVLAIFVFNYFKSNKNEAGEIDNGSQASTQSENYVVKKGDTLWSIAQRVYNDGYKWSQIAKDNKLEDASKIEVGQTLAISEPQTTVSADETPTTPQTTQTSKTTANNTTSPIQGATYKVVKGDSLWKIAVRAYGDGYKWSEIAKENKLTNPNIIHSNNILILPR